MEKLLIINKISVVAVWVIFWAFMITLRIVAKNEFQASFAGVRKMLSATVGMFIFFTILISVLFQDSLAMIDTVSAGWQFIWQLTGNAMLLSGFVLAMWIAWSLQNPLPVSAPKFGLFKYLRNMMYGAVLLIAFGSSFVLLNPLALAMSAVLIPYLAYRVKTENEANANI